MNKGCYLNSIMGVVFPGHFFVTLIFVAIDSAFPIIRCHVFRVDLRVWIPRRVLTWCGWDCGEIIFSSPKIMTYWISINRVVQTQSYSISFLCLCSMYELFCALIRQWSAYNLEFSFYVELITWVLLLLSVFVWWWFIHKEENISFYLCLSIIRL